MTRAFSTQIRRRNENESFEMEDFSKDLIFQPGTQTYQLVLRWRPLTHMDMIALALKFRDRSKKIDYLDIGQTSFEWNNIGNEGLKAILQAFQNNRRSRIKELDIHNNGIDDDGAIQLAEFLERNPVLSNVNIRFNQIGERGGVAIAHTFERNTHLKTIDMARCGIGDLTMLALKEALKKANELMPIETRSGQETHIGQKKHAALRDIFLENNDIGPDGLASLVSGLIASYDTHPIEQISLFNCQYVGHNNRDPCVDGIQQIGQLLLITTSLVSLDLGGCLIEDAGVSVLAESLSQASTLKSLNLQRNNLSNISAYNLKDALMKNQTLEELDLRRNKMNDEGRLKPREWQASHCPTARIEVIIWEDQPKRKINIDLKSDNMKNLFDSLSRDASDSDSNKDQQKPFNLVSTSEIQNSFNSLIDSVPSLPDLKHATGSASQNKTSLISNQSLTNVNMNANTNARTNGMGSRSGKRSQLTPQGLSNTSSSLQSSSSLLEDQRKSAFSLSRSNLEQHESVYEPKPKKLLIDWQHTYK
ncbi:MAG: putative Protein NLRC3 [Streblomastix strix]|uniref:Uncharacterized protein n=1 Tax=Streblomastix strix TaxID=222440 RepID=A0A5J4WY85_9EUKA|nr:MAG: putative Protein NLRC3 [Streblomastix strix]